MSDLQVLIIDDLRIARDPIGVTYARTPDDGVRYLSRVSWDVVCLDHDLGINFETGDDLTIWPCIEYIEEHPAKFEETLFYIVTSNPWGRDRMRAALDRKGLWNIVLNETDKRTVFSA